jgi:hypothetical protein
MCSATSGHSCADVHVMVMADDSNRMHVFGWKS